ncbi:MAG TPA: hypothetical protein VHL14_01310 [Steroidobacteraceae bacterium]|jgi:hypothetical protein|nr:hypothetical protein [Steroidobacteraceae bacterium]
MQLFSNGVIRLWLANAIGSAKTPGRIAVAEFVTVTFVGIIFNGGLFSG